MKTLSMKPQQMISHFQNLVATTNLPVRPADPKDTACFFVRQRYQLPSDLLVTATYNAASPSTKIVLKHMTRFNTLAMAGCLEELDETLDLSGQWFILHPDVASIVPVADEEELLIHHHSTLADLHNFLTWSTIEYRLLNHVLQPKITIDYSQTYGGWCDYGHGQQSPYCQAASCRELLQKVMGVLERALVLN